MPVITTPQDPSWGNNIYVLVTTRTLALMGTAFLVRLLYSLLPPTWRSRPRSIVAGKPSRASRAACIVTSQRLKLHSYPIAAVSGLALEELNSDTLPAEPGAATIDPDLDANLTLNLQRPQPSHDPHDPLQRAEANPRAETQREGLSETSVVANTIPEQDAGVHNNGNSG